MRRFFRKTFLKNVFLRIFAALVFLTSSSIVFADGLGDGSDGSPNISGIINTYTSVVSIAHSPCSSSITVLSSAGFAAGDLVLIIQMENATINATNTPSYGTILNYNNSGNFEYAKIFSVAGTTIQTVSPLANNYDIVGVLQLVRVPQYASPVITGAITCPAWNGVTGGIIALDATGTVNMNADIDAGGKGFRGGLYQPATDIHIHLGNYVALNQVDSFSYKGEGIASYNLILLVSGRGAAANGGGGGNSHNGGGGGGSNAGCGGNGGYGYTNAAYGVNYSSAQGIGGYALTNSGSPFKIFMGGGGGAGNSDNLSISSGANGGGIILITANSVNGNSKFISSIGNTSPDVVIDGAGGAGAGGTIIFDCSNVSSNIKLDVHGGNGGNVTAFPEDPHGPGGGGGGGLIALTNAALPPNVTVNSINGGSAGMCDGTTFNGAANGCIGNTSFNLALPGQLTPPTTITVKDTSFCDNGTLTLTATTGTTYSWTPAAGLSCTNCQSPVATVNATSAYIATVTFSSCIYIDTFNIQIKQLPNVTLSSFNPVCEDAAAFLLSGGNPGGGTYSGTGVIAGNFNPSIGGVGSDTIIYSYTDANGCTNSTAKNIIVNALPVVAFSAINPVCEDTPPFALSGGTPTGGTYSGVGVAGNNFNPAISGIGTQTITYSYIDGNGCSNSSTSNVTVNALPNVALSNFSSVCADAPSFALSGGSPAGGSYSGNGVTANNFDPSVTGAGVNPITYTYSDANSCSNGATKNITVNALPIVTLSAINPVCIASPSFTLTAGTPAGGTYSGTGVTGNNFDPSIAGTGNHKVYYSYSNANGCSNSDSTTITVYNIPQVIFTPVDSVCDGMPSFTLTGGTPAGGVYSGIGVVGTDFDPAIAGIGSQTITYSYTDAQGCSNSTTTNITVNALPNVTLSNFNSVCVNASLLVLSGGAPAGGIYSGIGVSTNNFDPAIAGAGTYPIIYSYTDSNGCSDSKTKSITVNSLPAVTFAPINAVCITSSSFALTTGTPAGGTYTGVGVTGNNFDPSVAGTGNHKVYYTYTDGNGCSNMDSTSVTVYDIPQVTFTALNPVCEDAPPFTITGGSPIGGTYSGSGIVGNDFDPAVAGTGTQTITYSYTDAQGCSNSATTDITVNALPNVTLSSFNSVCVDASSFALTGGAPAGGIYSGTAVSANNFDPATAGVGTYPITYSYTDVNGCSNSKTKSIAVNALPAVALSPINSVCIASPTFVLTTGTPSGGSYSGVGVNAGNFTPSIAGIGAHKIYYFYTDANGCSGSDSTTITVYNIPIITFTPVDSICDGSPAFALTCASPAGGTYSGVGVSGNNFDPAIAGMGTQTISYSYTDAQGCANSATTNITVNALPNVTLANFNSVCAGESSFALNGGLPAGGAYSGTGVVGNNFDPVLAGTGTHAITYTYTDVNGCSSSALKSITVNALPNINFSPINSVCIASPAFALTAGTPAGGSYSGVGVSAGNFTPSVAGTGTHKIYYFYTDANGCSGSDSTTITVYNIPIITFTPLDSICDGTPAFTLANASPSGGIYSGIGVVGSNFNPSIAGIGTQIITYSYTDAQGCSNLATTNITVNALPNVTLSNFNSVCVDASSFVLNGGSPIGGIYSGNGVSANNFVPPVAGVGTHAITYSYTDANGCSNAASKNIIVNALPIVTLSAINPVCIASSPFVLSSGTPVGGVYSGTGVSNGNFNPAIAGIGTHTIYYFYTDANGCSGNDSATITVYNIPSITFTPVNPVCEDMPAFTLTNASPSGGTYSGAGVSGNNFDPAVAGIGTHTILYSYTDAQGCSNSASTNITVNGLPNVTLLNFNAVCADAASFALNGGLPAGGVYSGAGVNANNFDPAIAGVGTHPITYSYTDTNGCSKSATKNITVNPLPVVNLSAINPVCIASSPFVLTNGTPAGGIYSGTGISGGIFSPSISGIGTHEIFYSYADANGCSNIDSTTVTVYNIPQVTFAALNPVCEDNPPFALSGGSPSGGTYAGTGVTANNFDPAIAGIGTQNIIYYYTDGNGCSNSAWSAITVNALPNVTLSNFNSVCQNSASFPLGGGSPVGGSYSGAGVAGNNFYPVSAGTGTFPIVYSYTDTNSCSNTATKNITVNPLIFLSAGNDETICSGYSVQLNASGTSNIQWTPSTGLSCTYCINPVANPSDTSTYVISSSLPCSTNDTVTVNVVPAVVIDAGNDTLLCFGETVQLNASSNYSSYNWDATGDLSCFNCPDPVAAPAETSVYTVTGTNGVCSSTDSVVIKVIKVEVTAINNATIAFGESMKLDASGADSYAWSPGTYLNDSTIQSPVASPYETIQYLVTGNIDRCTATDSVTIEIIYIGDAVFVPNAFTPDGDGKNDLFGAVHAGNYGSFEMKIFNRWGEMVFSSNNISQSWDGTCKGLRQPAGVYVYHIGLVSGKNKISRIGNVTLLR